MAEDRGFCPATRFLPGEKGALRAARSRVMASSLPVCGPLPISGLPRVATHGVGPKSLVGEKEYQQFQ